MSVDAVTSPVAGAGLRPARITPVSRHGIHCNGLHQSSPRIDRARTRLHLAPANATPAPARAPDGAGSRPVRARHDVRNVARARTGDQACPANRRGTAGIPARMAAPFLFLLRSEEHTSELQSLMRISY